MKLEIPAGDFSGYIFDLDGTLVDTMPLHYRAWDAAMRKVGLTAPLDEELFYSLGGVPTKRVAELISIVSISDAVASRPVALYAASTSARSNPTPRRA